MQTSREAEPRRESHSTAAREGQVGVRSPVTAGEQSWLAARRSALHLLVFLESRVEAQSDISFFFKLMVSAVMRDLGRSGGSSPLGSRTESRGGQVLLGGYDRSRFHY